MTDPESPVTVFFRAPSNIKLSAIRQLFPSITFTSRKRSARGDNNLQKAESYLRVTKEELDKIYNASQQASETFAGEIAQIEDRLSHISSAVATVKKTREGSSTLGRTFHRLGNDAATRDLLQVALELAEKAKHTSARVELTDSNITVQTAPSSECSVVPDNQSTAEGDLCGIGFAFDRQPNSDDARKIESIIHLIDAYPDDYSMEESGSVCGLRSKRSDLSSYSYHYWGQDAYKTGESSSSSDGTSSWLSSQCRPSSGMLFGAHTTLQHCNINIFNTQSNDSCTVSDATANVGVSFTGGGHPNTPPLPSAVCNSGGVEVIQTSGTSLQEAAIDSTQPVYSSAASLLELQNGIPAVPTIQSPSEIHPDEAGVPPASLPVSGSENITSHSMIVGESAVAFSPTMNFNSPGAAGATNIYLSAQPCSLFPVPGICSKPKS